MVKVKISKKKAKIIDDAESTPGQSRLFDMFEEQVFPYIKKNPEEWYAEFKKLKTSFEVKCIEYNGDKDETIVMFGFNGGNK